MRARALMVLAKETHRRLCELPIERYPSNTLIDYYDIIHKLIDAACLLEGWRFTGEGAHKELIDAVCSFGLSSSDRAFLQSIRDYRNRIRYEGHYLDSGFIQRNAVKIEVIIAKLTTFIEERVA